MVANKEKAPIIGSGVASITTLTDNDQYDVVVEGVLHVSSLTTILISMSELIAKDNRVQFTSSGYEIYNKFGELFGAALLLNVVYKLRLKDELMGA